MHGGIALVGSGSATPCQTLTNDQLGLRVETNDSWIRSRTGIAARCVSGPEESLSSLGTKAGLCALQMAGWEPSTLDLVVLAVRADRALGASEIVWFLSRRRR